MLRMNRFQTRIQTFTDRLLASLLRGRKRRQHRLSERSPERQTGDSACLVEAIEDRTLLSGHGFTYGPGTSQEYIDALEEVSRGTDGDAEFTLLSRWSTTATDGSGLGQGDVTTLTWSIVDDGTPIPALGNIVGESSDASTLVARLGVIYGVNTNDTVYTDEPWFPHFVSYFDRWEELTGINYVYEPADDGAAFSNISSVAPGVLGVRGDMRIGGHPIDGNSNVLAYNFFPNNGEMVIDTNDNFFDSTAQNSRGLRNTLAHENGHGIGIRHSTSANSDFLMEPSINLAFDGPQFDDILGAHRFYGDANGDNNTFGSATSLGAVVFGETLSVGTDADDMVVEFTDTDFVSIDDETEVDFYSFTLTEASDIRLTLTPKGPTYLNGPQGGTETNFVSSQQSDLTLELIDTNGSTVLVTANANGLGGAEVINSALSSAGTYFARITGAQDAVQMYQLDLIAKPEGGFVPFEQVRPLGGLISSSDNNFGNLANASAQQDFDVFLEGGQTLSAVAVPDGNVSLTLQLVGQSGTFSSPAAGQAASLPATAIPADGTYTLRVTTDGATDFQLLSLRNAAIADVVVDTSDGNELDIDNTLIQLGSGRFGVFGTSSSTTTTTLEFAQSSNPSGFVDISGTGNVVVLGDESRIDPTTTVGNSIFPAGLVSITSNGGLIAGGGTFLGFQNDPLPSSEFGNALLPLWDDMTTSNVFWQDTQVNGINTFIVQWDERPHFNFPGSAVTFQVQLFESGPILARYAYEDITFGNATVDGGASATIGYQENSTTALEFSRDTASLSDGDVVDLQFAIAPDVDEYEIDLTGKAGELIDIVLAGVDGNDFSDQTLELLDTNGTTVLATGVTDPVTGGTDTTNFDLGILDFTVPANGVYTVRVTSEFADADYTVVVTDPLTHDTEPNNVATDPLRDLTTTRQAVGNLDASTDQDDFYKIDLTLNDVVIFETDTLFDHASTVPVNSLNPELQVTHPNGSTIVATDTNSASDGKNARVSFTAPATGTYTFRVRATSGSGEYLLSEGSAPTNLDFGDAPSAAQSGFANSYPVTLADDGARHGDSGATLGSELDFESDGTHSANADADDTTNTGSADDEDGIVFGGTLIATSTATATGSVSVDLQDPAATNLLDAWIDFNQDGDWNDPGEQIFTSFNLGGSAGIQNLNFTIPQDTGTNVVSGTTFSRFRVSAAGGLSPTGSAPDGEVEDHVVTVTGGDAILTEPFDDSSQFTVSEGFFSLGDGSAFFGISDGAGGGDFGPGSPPTPTVKAYTGLTGNFLTGMDMDAAPLSATLPITTTFSGLDISGKSGLLFSGDFAEFFEGAGGDPGANIEPDDFIRVEAKIDGGSFATIMEFRGNNTGGTNAARMSLDTNGDGIGDGTLLGTDATTFTADIAGTGNLLDLRISVSVSDQDEDFAIDNVTVFANSAPGIFLVDTLVDEDDGDYSAGDHSLREAIDRANTHVGADEIQFASGLSGNTITLTVDELEVTDDLTITGLGASNLTVSGGNAFRVFNLQHTPDVIIDGLTITGGRTTVAGRGGAGIFSSGTLQLTNSVVTNNHTVGAAADGGGIFQVDGTLTITDSTISNNSTSGDGSLGGGISSREQIGGTATVTITRSIIDGNSTAFAASLGGGIITIGSDLTITDSTISGNENTGAGAVGGGVVGAGGNLIITGSTVSGNDTTGNGGGVAFDSGGGAVTATILNSTISGNTTTVGFGGGVANFNGTMNIQHSTLTANTAPAGEGSGLASFSDGSSIANTVVLSSIIADNTNSDVDNKLSGSGSNTITSSGFNLVGSGNATGSFNQGSDQTGVSAGLGILANNGGATETHAPQAGSLAINVGDTTSAQTTDQRGAGFARVVGGNVDIGAFEVQDTNPSVTLSVDNANIPEAAGVATFTATLSEISAVDVTVDLGLTGTATGSGTDYNVSGTQIVISAGTLTGAITVTAVQDMVDDDAETIIVDITSVTNGTESGTQQQTSTIDDDDELLEYGDAPTAAQAGGGTFLSDYPVTLAENGARHGDAGATLGANLDLEINGIHSTDADADDTTGTPDDEDGVTFAAATLLASTVSASPGNVTIDLQDPHGSSNKLDAWIDWNRDGDWNDDGEKIFDDFDLGLVAGTQDLVFQIPRDTGTNVVPGTTYARFRLSSAGGLDPTGFTADGEVEDYKIEVANSLPLVITEIMFDPDSPDSTWEWVEIYNAGTTEINLTGYLLDDSAGTLLTAANIAGGAIPADSYAVLYDSATTSADFTSAWRQGINLIPVTSWPSLNNTGDDIGLWSSLADYGSRDFTTAVDETQFEDNTNGWPNATGNGASFYLTDVNANNNDGSNWAVSVSGTDGAYMSAVAGTNTGNDVGSPGFGTAAAVSTFSRVDPFGSLISISSNSGSIGAGETLEFSAYLDGGQTLAGNFDLTAAGSVSIEVVGVSGVINSSGGDNFVVLPLQQIDDPGTYTIRVTSTAAANFDLGLVLNAILEEPDSSNGSELLIDDSLLDGPTAGRWAVIGTTEGTDVDEYTINLTGFVGDNLDIALVGIPFDGDPRESYEAQTLELLDTNGTTVLATGTATPLTGGVNATNGDLAILDFPIPADGIYTLRVNATFNPAAYTLVVARDVTVDVEPNNNRLTDPLRSLTANEDAIGYLEAGTDNNDFFTVDLVAGEQLALATLFPLEPLFSPLNTLNPELELFNPAGTSVGTDLNSGADGVNAALAFTAASTGTHVVRVGATSGLGEYLLSATVNDISAPSLSITRDTPATSPTNADTLTFRLTFDEDVQNVDAADFDVTGAAPGTTTLSTISASVYTLEISGGDVAGFNGLVGIDLDAAQNITDLAGNALPQAEPTVDETYLLDNNAPTFVSIVRQNPLTSLTDADTLVFRATFDEDVQNVDGTDFAVTGTTATITNFAVVSATQYDITVSGGNLNNLNADVGLDLAGGQNIGDLAGNALPNAEPATDEVFTVVNLTPPTGVFINEILIDPDGSPDAPDEYVELRGPANESLAGVFLILLESDSGTTLGEINSNHIIDLTGTSIGSNGFLAIVDATGGTAHSYAIAAGTTIVDIDGLDFENASYTAFLIHHDGLGADPVNGQDLDAGDDGLDALPSGWTILDGVSVLDGGAADRAYADIVFSADADGLTETGATFVNTGFGVNDVMHVMRKGNSTGSTATDWVAFEHEVASTAPNFTIAGTTDAAYTVGTVITSHLGQVNPTFTATADLSVTTQGNEAGPVDIVFTVSLSTTNISGSAVTFDFDDLLTGSATSGTDYTAVGGAATISVADGATTGSIAVAVTNDALLEADETVTAQISNSNNPVVTIGTASATGSILNDDTATADLSVTTHGDEDGPVDAVYTVTLSKANNTGSAITFDLDDLLTGTATSTTDYAAIDANAEISVANGATTGTLAVDVSNDTLLEAVETVIAQISNSSNDDVTIGTATATANIEDDETASASISVTTHGNENGPVDIVYTVTLDTVNNTGSAITFDLDDLGTGTATSGSDYAAIAANAVVSIAAGANTGTLAVDVTDDAELESLETVIVQISNSSNAAVTIGTASATANITDDDSPQVGSITADLSVTTHGNEAGPANIVYTVTFDKVNATGSAITFDFDDLGTGTATSGDDYTAVAANAQISVANGATTGTLSVVVTDDALLEAEETLIARISNSSSAAATIGVATATANITDNDVATADLSVTTHGNEAGPVDAVYTVTLSKTNNTGAIINFDLDDLLTGTASSGDDYAAIAANAQISIADGASAGTLIVDITDDALLEDLETIIAQISNSSNGAVTIGTASATANITNDDTATADLSVTTQGNEAGPVDAVFTVTLSQSNNSGAAITFDFGDLGTGTATSGDDYAAVAANAQISIADGATTGTLSVDITDDALLEAVETVIAQISNSSLSAVTVGTASATANITDNDVATADLSVTTQGDEAGPVDAVFTVTLSKTNNTGTAITFDLDDLGTGTATSGDDYVAIAANAQISVADGATTGTFAVDVTDDALLEAVETVIAQISNSSNGAVSGGTASAAANITDNDTATADLSVTTQGNEAGPVDAVFTVTLSKTNNTGTAITFDLDDLGTGTATSGDDYAAIAANAQISIANGATTGTLSVDVTDDALLESVETVIAQISNSSNGAVTTGAASATANITDNDVATADLSVTTQGNEAGPVDAVYTVTLSKTNNTGTAITFDLDDLGTGTATSGDDYAAIAANAQISIADGATTGTLSVDVTDDALLEAVETVIAQISNSSNGAVSTGTASATANITDNDVATADLSVTTQGDEAGPVDAVYTVTLSKTNNTGTAITFDLDDLGTGTATSGDDYTAIATNAQISVADGATTGTLAVDVTDDALLEAVETVIAQISNSSNGAVTTGTASATANITDNDVATADLSVTTQGNEAGPVDAVYTVTLSKTNNTGTAITFDLDDLGTGTATSGDDYTAIAANAQISVADGATTGTLSVDVTDDALLEAVETIIAQISNSSNGAVSTGTASATANITDNDVATADLSVTTQGNEAGPVDAVFTVTLSKTNNTGTAITFDLDDLGTGTATSGDDYTAIGANAQISVADGATTGTFAVDVTDDALLEAVETIIAQISNSSNGAVSTGAASATANITDNDVATADLSVTTQGNEAGPVDAVYTVTLSKTNNTGTAITFDLDDLGTGTATSGDDYAAIAANAQISIADGATTGTLSVDVTDDALLEAVETVIAQISNSSNGAVSTGTASATANITDNDVATADLSVTTQGDEAGPVDAVYTVTLSKTNNTGTAITFDLDDLGTGTATSGDDYTAIATNAQISVADGATTGTLAVDVTDDALLEAVETVIAQISNSSNGAVTTGTASATANITDNDVATADLSVTTQGNEAGPVDAVYTVTLSKTNNTGTAITFDLDDLGTGTATSGDDYTAIAANAQISIADGATTGTLSVDVTDDALLEAVETIIAQISNSSNGAVTTGAASATANITDNDVATADLSVTTQGNEAGPVDAVYTVTLSKTNNTGTAITFDLDDLGTGTATSGDDYAAIAANAQISIADGATTGTLSVDVTDDALLEAVETIIAQISNSSNGAVTTGAASATANITDNDVATADLSVTTQGNEAGPVDAVYTVTLSKTNNTGTAITFDLDDLGTGTATSGDDYAAIAANAQISIADGATTGTLSVDVTDDALLEAVETIIAQISSSSNGAVSTGTASATANITDNDTATADLSVTTQGNEAGPVDAVFTVTLSKTNNTGTAITFDLDDLGTGTATSGDDYAAIAANAQISIADGATTGTLSVDVTDDALLEAVETVIAQISNSSNGAVTTGAASATANITDNDVATADLSVTTQGNEAGPVDAVYTVTLSKTNNTGTAITFDLDDLGTGTATSGDDYAAIAANAQISIADGATTGTLSVDVTDDALLEAVETVIAQISNSSNTAVSVGTASATANITDNDVATADLSVTTQGNEAGPVDAVYTVTLSKTNNTGAAITFDLDDLGTGTATSGDDYTAIAANAQISIADGATTGTLSVDVTDDALLEAVETVIAQISNSSNTAVSVGTASATANITDNDVATADLSVTTQGNEAGPVDAVYTVTLSKTNNTGAAITFDLDDLGTGTATSGDDYTAIAANAQISIADGATTGTLAVDVIDDAIVEALETVIAQISNSSNTAVTIGAASATANIADNESTVANLSVSTQGNEAGPVNMVFLVTLTNSNNTGTAITFDLDDLGTGTATSGDDYTAIAANAQISVADGATTGTLSVSVTDDALLESVETVIAQISNSSNPAVTFGTDSATANITDNDVATADLSVTTQGNEAGPVDAVFTVTLSKTNNTGTAITFDLDDLGTGTATSGDDYTAIAANAQISVADGATTGTLSVDVTDDALLEAVETIIAQISNSSNGAVSTGTASATANITDNDVATADLSVTTQGDEAGPVDAVYTVTLSKTNNTGTAITFDLDDLGTGTATSGDDYAAIAANAQISIANGATTGTLAVDVTDDALLEAVETIIAQISNSSNGAVSTGTDSATANITDNDTATADLSVTTQGDEAGPVDAVFTVTLSKTNNTGTAITFDLDDLGTGTATSGDDYAAIAANAQISIADGATTGTLSVDVTDDALLESVETVIAQISNSSNAAVSTATAIATANITNNDTATANLSVTTQGNEAGPVDAVFTVTLSQVNNSGAAITFDLDDLGTGTATSGDDYAAVAANAQISIADGATMGTLAVEVSDDALLEADETVIAQILNPSLSAVTTGTATATANITDNETATADLAVTTQGNEAGPVDAVFTVTLSKANNTGAAISFDLDDLGTGTATSGDDYAAVAANAQISVANGATTGTLALDVTDDSLLESTETVVARISNSSNTAVSVGTGTITANITDNDTATADLSVTTQGNETGPVDAIFTVTLNKTNNTGTPITFDLDDLGTGTATSGDDYVAVAANAQVSVANGASTGTLAVGVIDDSEAEGTETVIGQISNSSSAAVTIGAATATADISDNDSALIQIIDDIDGGGGGFDVQGGWSYLSKPGRGRDDDFHYKLPGTGNDVATWTFDITPGEHRVSATWSALFNRASDAEYTVFDGNTQVGVFEVDQRVAPNDFADAGSSWHDLQTYTFTSNQIIVQLSDDADNQVIADAIRIESLMPPVVVTESGGSTEVTEGGNQDTYTIGLGSTPAGSVEITATADSQTEISLDGTNFASSVTFSRSDTSAQTITVRAIDDAVGEGNHVGVVTHQITATNDPTNYPLTLEVPSVNVDISDNDAAIVQIIDDIDGGGGGFDVQGGWSYLSKPGRGRDDDFHYKLPGTGNDVATWTFDITPGEHRVSATWSALFNRASDAEYTVFDGNTQVGVFEVDQRVAPNDFADAGSSWHDLQTYTFTSNQIIVQLSDDADNQVIADAVRIERIMPPVVVTESGGSTEVTEGGNQDTYTIGLGSTPAGSVEITATADSQTEISLDGTNFASSVTFSRSDTSAQTITVRAIDDAVGEGNHVGVVTHQITATNDPTNYPLTLEVPSVNVDISDNDAAIVQIIDDIDGGGGGFDVQGGWSYLSKPGRGRDDDFHYKLPGTGNDVATWTFDITPGEHRVSATWSALFNRASDAEYTVFDGNTQVGVFEVDQRVAPNDFADAGSSWHDLQTYTFTSNQIIVQLSDDADNQVIADAVRIERIGAGIFRAGGTSSPEATVQNRLSFQESTSLDSPGQLIIRDQPGMLHADTGRSHTTHAKIESSRQTLQSWPAERDDQLNELFGNHSFLNDLLQL